MYLLLFTYMYLLYFLFSNLGEEFKSWRNNQENKKKEIKKQLEKSIISDGNENTDIKKKASKVKNSEEAAAVIQEMEKIITNKNSNILWLAYQQDKSFEKLTKNL